ncbi:MAG TPA: glycosyltransferase [Devosiaceae bacterium]|nr:glycosyltransferase [Devosiaceae bacterium]
MSKLAVFIVTHDSAATLPAMLDSMPAGLAGIEQADVVVADNVSRDGSAEIAEAHPTRPRVIRTGRDAGYAAGINAAAATVDRDADILVLNSDILLMPGSVRLLVERLKDPRVGVAAPRILNKDKSEVASLRREPSIVTAWSDALLGETFGRRFGVGETVLDPRRYRSDGLVDWASGAALAVSARARSIVGDWDESFFLYSEEVDYQRRIRDAGLAIAYVARSEIIHIGGDYQSNPKLYALLTANRIRYFARHHDPFSAAAFRLAVLSGEALRSFRGSPVHRAGMSAAVRRWRPFQASQTSNA